MRALYAPGSFPKQMAELVLNAIDTAKAHSGLGLGFGGGAGRGESASRCRFPGERGSGRTTERQNGGPKLHQSVYAMALIGETLGIADGEGTNGGTNERTRKRANEGTRER
jgi:hypothetical protein